MQHDIDVATHVHVVGDIGAHEPKPRPFNEMRDVRRGTGGEVVGTQHLVAVIEQAFAQVRAQEAGTAGNNRPALLRAHRHVIPLLSRQPYGP